MSDRVDTEIRRAYDQTDFEMVPAGNGKYEMPVSTAARYRLERPLTPAYLRKMLEKRDYMFIAPYSEEDYLSSKILDQETNEFLHIKLNHDLLRIFPKGEDFSMETLERLVRYVDNRIVGVELEVDHDE